MIHLAEPVQRVVECHISHVPIFRRDARKVDVRRQDASGQLNFVDEDVGPLPVGDDLAAYMFAEFDGVAQIPMVIAVQGDFDDMVFGNTLLKKVLLEKNG